MLVDISAADYLGWGAVGVAGYIGTPSGRDLNAAGSQGFQRVPDPKPKRFSVSYHLLRVADEPAPRAACRCGSTTARRSRR